MSARNSTALFFDEFVDFKNKGKFFAAGALLALALALFSGSVRRPGPPPARRKIYFSGFLNLLHFFWGVGILPQQGVFLG